MPGYVEYQGTRQVFGPGGKVHFFGLAGGAVPSGTLQTFTVKNDSQANHGYYKTGLVFAKGDVPSGSVPVVKKSGSAVTAQFSERATWSDGSLKHCTVFIRDTDWGSGETSREFTVEATSGSFNDTGTLAVSDVTTNYDFKVTVANCTTNGTATTRSDANGDGAFNTHSGTGSRLTKIYSGPICEGWKCWGYVGSGPDTDLIVYHYVELYKTSGGAIHHARYAPVLEMTKWQSTTKARLDYDCTVKDGATTLATFTGVEHPYHSTWAGIDNSDTVNEGKPHTIGVTAPKFIYVHDWDYWSGTGVLPPVDWTQTPDNAATAGITSRYTPCESMDHRSAIAGTGPYIGRGMLNQPDVIAACLGTHADFRAARVNAFAGLHIPNHYRDDTTNLIKALKLEGHGNTNGTTPPAGAIDYDFTGDGMPSPVDAYVFGTTTYKDSYGAVTGGSGVWSLELQNPHRHVYSKFMWLVEREHYMLQSELDNANGTVQYDNGNEFGSRPQRLAPKSYTMNAGTEQFGGIASFSDDSNRSIGFGTAALVSGAICVPDDAVEANYMRALAAHTTKYFARSIDENMTADALASGLIVAGDQNHSPWMCHFIPMAFRDAYKGLEDNNALTVVQHTAKYVAAQWAKGGYATLSYRAMTFLNGETWNSSTNQFLSAANVKELVTDASVTASTDYLRVDISATAGGRDIVLTDGDIIYFSATNTSDATGTVPSEVSLGTPYYVVQAQTVSAGYQDFKISTSEGGAPVNFTSDYASVTFGHDTCAEFSTTPAANPPYLPNADSYPMIAWAGLVAAADCSVTVASEQTAAAATWIAGIDSSAFPVWRYKEPA